MAWTETQLNLTDGIKTGGKYDQIHLINYSGTNNIDFKFRCLERLLDEVNDEFDYHEAGLEACDAIERLNQVKQWVDERIEYVKEYW
jgi:hypothetical protein